MFTSGGTEADNLAVIGVAEARGGARHIVTSAIEHPAVLQACARLEKDGVAVTRVGVGASGVIDPDDVRRALRPETVLVSVMHANNELGTLQPVEEIARIAHDAGALMHSDGVQAFGKTPADVRSLGVDCYVISGHKVNAPKGVGALYVRQGAGLSPRSFGGRHEGGRRAGTEGVPGIVALGRAAQWIGEHSEAERARVGALRDRLETAILARVPKAAVNGNGARTPNTVNIRFPGIEGEALLIALDLEGFAVSSGAACSSGAVEPSHVLTAIGLSKPAARSSIRFSLGRSNDEAEVDALIETVIRCAARLRAMAPVEQDA